MPVDYCIWDAPTLGLNSGSAIENINCITSDGAGRWITGHNSGYAAISINNCLTWSGLPRGLNSGANEDILDIATDENGTWIAIMRDGYAVRSLDDGDTWSALTRG